MQNSIRFEIEDTLDQVTLTAENAPDGGVVLQMVDGQDLETALIELDADKASALSHILLTLINNPLQEEDDNVIEFTPDFELEDLSDIELDDLEDTKQPDFSRGYTTVAGLAGDTNLDPRWDYSGLVDSDTNCAGGCSGCAVPTVTRQIEFVDAELAAAVLNTAGVTIPYTVQAAATAVLARYFEERS